MSIYTIKGKYAKKLVLDGKSVYRYHYSGELGINDLDNIKEDEEYYINSYDFSKKEFKKVYKKTNENKEEVLDFISERFTFGIMNLVVGSIIFIPLSCAINKYDKIDKHNERTIELTEKLEGEISSQVGLDNFDLASVNVVMQNDNYLLTAFGSVKVNYNGGIQPDLKNVIFKIDEEQAKSILEQLAKLDNTKYSSKYGEFILNVDIDQSNIKKKEIAAHTELVETLYGLLSNAIVNNYGYTVNHISDSGSLKREVSNAYRITRPETVTSVSGFLVDSTFHNAGIVTTGISSVYEDDERNVSFFYVDTIQAFPKGDDVYWKSCKARVEVEGVGLTPEEVYAKFIAGEHSNFVELTEFDFTSNQTVEFIN